MNDIFDLEAANITEIIDRRTDYIYNTRGDKYINIQYTCEKCKTFSCVQDTDFRVELPRLIMAKSNKKIKEIIILPEIILCNWKSFWNFCSFNTKCFCLPLFCCFLPMLPYIMIKKRKHILHIVVFFSDNILLN